MLGRIVAACFLQQVSQSSKSNNNNNSNNIQGWVVPKSWRKPSILLQEFAKRILTFLMWMAAGIVSFFALYYALASPPMHFIYDVAPPAGPSTIYVPGGGFSGFWFHLGFLHSLQDNNLLHDYDYYCFSSGCLGVLAVLLNRTLDETANAAFDVQRAWHSGSSSRFDLVDHFVDVLLPEKDTVLSSNLTSASHHNMELETIFPRMKILLTTQRDGHQVREATNRQELKDLLIKTTWVPYLTGWGFLTDTSDNDTTTTSELYFDGGFSRLLHPECEHRLDLPMIWETIIHTFSPGLTRDQVGQLWQAGYHYDYSISSKTTTTTTTTESSLSPPQSAPTL